MGIPIFGAKVFPKNGQKLKIYPVYCSESLKTFLVGEPVEFDPDRSVKEQSAEINKYLEKRLASWATACPNIKLYCISDEQRENKEENCAGTIDNKHAVVPLLRATFQSRRKNKVRIQSRQIRNQRDERSVSGAWKSHVVG